MLHVLPSEIVLTFVAGVVAGVAFLEGIVRRRRERKATVARRLLG